MGGHALKNVKVVRFNLEEYNDVKDELITLLNMAGLECSVPHSRHDKDSFGDLDILVKVRSDIDLKQWIIDILDPVEIVTNVVHSFSYLSIPSRFNIELNEYYQIDFIPVNSIECGMLYYSYGDIGAIIGKYTSYNGIKFNDNGLGIKIQNKIMGIDTNPFYSYNIINLTSDPYKVCEILGLDYDKWKTLSNEDDVFNWVISSKYYTPNAFEFISMNKRKRIDSRPMYQNFLKRIGIKEIDNIGRKQFLSIDFEYQKFLLKEYNKWSEVEHLKSQILLIEERKKKFSSKSFIDFGLKDKDIGNAISKFKSQFLDFNEWLDSMESSEKVDIHIKNFLFN